MVETQVLHWEIIELIIAEIAKNLYLFNRLDAVFAPLWRANIFTGEIRKKSVQIVPLYEAVLLSRCTIYYDIWYVGKLY